MTWLNLTAVHYGLAFLNDWLLSFNVFFSPSDFLSSPLRHSSLDTHRQRKKNYAFVRDDWQWTLRFLFLLALGQFHQKLYFTNCVWKCTLNSVGNFQSNYAYNRCPGTLYLSVLWKYFFFSLFLTYFFPWHKYNGSSESKSPKAMPLHE